MGKLRRVGGEGNDLISELNDDVLDSLPTMADVVRAGAASRRWRHLSTRVPSLRFGFTEDGVDAKPKRREKFDRFVAFVNHVLDARAASAGIEQLAISIQLYDRGAAHAVAAWIRGYGSSAPEPEPIAAAYSAGSCCPRLRKLRLVSVVGLRSSAVARRRRSLQQFPRNRAFGVLELNTPNLRSLKMCCYAPGTLRISAPRLEELRSSNNVIDMRWQCVEQLDVGDLSCVRGLREIDLSSRGHPVRDAGINDGPIHLLRRCTAIESLGVRLVSPDKIREMFLPCGNAFHEEEEKEEVDDMMKDVPHLPGVTSLTIRDSTLNERALMTGVTCLLARCNSLRYFQLNMTSPIMDSTIAAGNQASIISLPHLTEVEISGFRGRKCEARLMERLHASATALNKITLRFDWLFTVESSREERINSLPLIPFGEVGK
uniref:F-box domain-containing protein n=1 Tax=Oryza rufipogon TaxID=4529 RepID=A0A0E0QGM6_ORYRU